MPRHKEPTGVWPLPKRTDTPHEKILHDPSPRLIATGSDHTVSCFACGSWPCTCT